ncbi:head GIN domain-containing protein [Maribellus maritimus]|uniref:head GIN domain-containing protein n=1 Tax=Maribellus maritimus TaxID=2870838 RepID=UPI001EEA2323|nr:head GIN domain-containing protein [Maribellus maritimus]MCG6188131.1 DUF2807 domain-containing protein [Maribellus maritimus]
MRSKIFLSLIVIFTASFFSSCTFMGPSIKGNGNVVEETRDIGSFDEIKARRGINVYITQGNTEKVVVKADDNLLDAIETKIEANTLVVSINKNIRSSTSLKVFVTVSAVNEITSTAGSNVFSENTIKTKSLELSTSAGSNMKLDVDTRKLNVSASAGSNIKLEGRSELFTGKASAGSNIKAGDLTVDDCDASASSGANIWIDVREKLDGRASSGGNVFYSGNPKSINTDSSSGGNVRKN